MVEIDKWFLSGYCSFNYFIKIFYFSLFYIDTTLKDSWTRTRIHYSRISKGYYSTGMYDFSCFKIDEKICFYYCFVETPKIPEFHGLFCKVWYKNSHEKFNVFWTLYKILNIFHLFISYHTLAKPVCLVMLCKLIIIHFFRNWSLLPCINRRIYVAWPNCRASFAPTYIKNT